MSQHNKRILAVLNRLYVLRLLQADELKTTDENKATLREWEAKANQRAISVIEGLTYNLKSSTEAMKLPGIGKGIGGHITKILSGKDPVITGIDDLDKATPEMKAKVIAITDMMKLPGIGIKKAQQFYDKGFISAAKLSAALGGEKSEGKIVKATTRQAIGAKYYKEFAKKIPRDKITSFSKIFRTALKAINASHNPPGRLSFIVAGSYRRGLSESGDIDIIIVSPNKGEVATYFPKLITSLQAERHLLETISDGVDKYEGVARIDTEYPAVRIDINKINDVWAYPYALLYFTGSKNFNINMRDWARDHGYTLANVDMTIIATAQKVYVKDENEIFSVLGLEYVPPEQRNI